MARPSGTGEGEWRAAIRKACFDITIDEDGTRHRRLDMLARRVVAEALAGQPWAVSEVGNRIDGRPAQAIELREDRAPALEGPERLVELGRRVTYLLTLASQAAPALTNEPALTNVDVDKPIEPKG